MKVRLTVGDKEFPVTLLQSAAPKTCKAFWKKIPLVSFATHAKFAGAEFFFMVPFFAGPENQLHDVTTGDVAYYPEKQTICIFYGRVRPFANVNVFGKVIDNLESLRIVGKEILDKGPLTVSVKKLSG